jgi:acyl-CoA synthetase (AMP-forming)/AMP-acid ligase II
MTTIDVADPMQGWRSLTDALSTQARLQPDKLAYTYLPPRDRPAVSLTYAQLERRAQSIAADLMSRNLEGQMVLLLYPPGLEFIEAFYACLYANISAIPMYIPPQSRPDTRLAAIAETVEIAAVITCQARLEPIQSLARELLPHRECPVVATDAIETGPGGEWTVPTDLAIPPLIQFTSGSTSRPKGVRVSHHNILINQHMIKRGFGHRGGETVVSWLPFFHDMGLIGAIMQPVYIGGTSVLMSSADFLQNPAKWLQLVSDYRSHTSGAPNFAYDYCLAKLTDEEIDRLDLSCWKVAYNGAEMIRPQTMIRFADRFARTGFEATAVLNCYGMAETTLYLAAGRCFPGGIDAKRRSDPDSIACVGHPAEESTVRIVDEDRRVLGPLEVGEIWARGPQVADGYVNNPDATQKTFEAILPSEPDVKYLRTGDLGYFDENGLHIVGRLKNMMILNGKNYYGEEIEYFSAQYDPRIYPSGACIMQLNEGTTAGEIVLALEIRKDRVADVAKDPESVDALARGLVSAIMKQFNLPVRRVCFLRENRLPRTSSGKIDRGNSPKFIELEHDKLLREVAL